MANVDQLNSSVCPSANNVAVNGLRRTQHDKPGAAVTLNRTARAAYGVQVPGVLRMVMLGGRN